jgi:hypothetical protein
MGEIELSSVKKMQDLSNMEGDMRAEESEVVSKMNLSPEKNKKSQEETKESSKKPKNKKLEQQESPKPSLQSSPKHSKSPKKCQTIQEPLIPLNSPQKLSNIPSAPPQDPKQTSNLLEYLDTIQEEGKSLKITL